MQKILVVEDDPDLNQAIGYALQKAGYRAYSAANGLADVHGNHCIDCGSSRSIMERIPDREGSRTVC